VITPELVAQLLGITIDAATREIERRKQAGVAGWNLVSTWVGAPSIARATPKNVSIPTWVYFAGGGALLLGVLAIALAKR